MAGVAGSGQMAVAVRAKVPVEITPARTALVRALERAVENTKPAPEQSMNGKKALPLQVHSEVSDWPNGLGMG